MFLEKQTNGVETWHFGELLVKFTSFDRFCESCGNPWGGGQNPWFPPVDVYPHWQLLYVVMMPLLPDVGIV
jgi:hypothetical protein